MFCFQKAMYHFRDFPWSLKITHTHTHIFQTVAKENNHGKKMIILNHLLKKKSHICMNSCKRASLVSHFVQKRKWLTKQKEKLSRRMKRQRENTSSCSWLKKRSDWLVEVLLGEADLGTPLLPPRVFVLISLLLRFSEWHCGFYSFIAIKTLRLIYSSRWDKYGSQAFYLGFVHIYPFHFLNTPQFSDHPKRHCIDIESIQFKFLFK